MDISTVGERIRSRREQLKLTQVDLGGRMKIAGAYISEIENGKRDIGLTMLARVATALECNPVAFLEPELVKCDKSETTASIETAKAELEMQPSSLEQLNAVVRGYGYRTEHGHKRWGDAVLIAGDLFEITDDGTDPITEARALELLRTL